MRSWQLDGSPGPLAVEWPDAHSSEVRALAIVEHDGAPLIISAGHDGALRSWHADGLPGPLAIESAHSSEVRALAIVEHDGAPLIISGDADGAIIAFQCDCRVQPAIPWT
jgi:WD40 repeat protein